MKQRFSNIVSCTLSISLVFGFTSSSFSCLSSFSFLYFGLTFSTDFVFNSTSIPLFSYIMLYPHMFILFFFLIFYVLLRSNIYLVYDSSYNNRKLSSSISRKSTLIKLALESMEACKGLWEQCVIELSNDGSLN